MELNGQIHVLTALDPGKWLPIGFRAGLDAQEKRETSRPCRETQTFPSIVRRICECLPLRFAITRAVLEPTAGRMTRRKTLNTLSSSL